MKTSKSQGYYRSLNRRIRTTLYDDQRFSETEFDLLHTPALQRLYELHQLGLTDRIFIDASHSRLHHVLGVMEQADKIMDAIIENLRKQEDEKLFYGRNEHNPIRKGDLSEIATRRKSTVRLMAMLHDLPHAPYGHTLEDEIRLVDVKHDQPERQAEAYFRLLLQYFGWLERDAVHEWEYVDGREPTAAADANARLEWYLDAPQQRPPPPVSDVDRLVERWGQLLKQDQFQPDCARRISPEMLKEFLLDLRFAMRALLYLEIAHKEPVDAKPEHFPKPEYAFELLLTGLLTKSGCVPTEQDAFNRHRDVFLLDVIGNTICADLLDYARRDSACAGLRLDYDPTRIVGNMTVTSHHTDITMIQGTDETHPFSGDALRTAVSLFSHKLRTDVPGELLNLLQVRYYVYERMLFHPTKCVAGAMLGAAVQFIGWRQLPEHLRFLGDDVFLHVIEESARVVRDLLASDRTSEQPFLANSFQGLLKRLDEPSPTTAYLTARTILNDRVPRRSALLAFFKNLRENSPAFTDTGLACRRALLKHVPETLEELTAEHIKAINEELGTQTKALDLFRRAFATLKSVYEEMCAAVRLIQRLRARRYHKTVFRMLPGHASEGLHPKEVSAKFLNAGIRKEAEREIERRMTPPLPLGTVVIHCPPDKGPIKIANILVSNGSPAVDGDFHKTTRRLREIGQLDHTKNIFKAHQESVEACEHMYQSVWRLSVSVAPPHEGKWRTLEKVCEQVVAEILLGRPGSIRNDEFMQRELTHYAELNAHIKSETDGGASEPAVFSSEASTDLHGMMIDEIKKDNRFARFFAEPEKFTAAAFKEALAINGATSKTNDPELLRKIETKKSVSTMSDRSPQPESNPFPDDASITAFLAKYVRRNELSGKDQKRYDSLADEIKAMGPEGKVGFFRLVASYEPAEALNRCTTLDELIKALNEAKYLDAPPRKD